MPALTQLQARDGYIIDSLAMFFDRNLKPGYDAEAMATAGATEDFSVKIRIRLGDPTNTGTALTTPLIAIVDKPASTADDFFEMGSNTKWRHMNFDLYCYPAIRADGYPSDKAALLLKAYMRNVLSTVSIRILDYSNPGFSATNLVYTAENMYIVSRSNPANRGKRSTTADEINRFDLSLRVKYPVVETTAT
jgi:hypothetical protein